jgi:DNA helicase-2/ATP-dependent DNA helicase PcrA
MPEVIYSEETGIEFSTRDYVKNYYITSSNFKANKKRYIEDYLAEEARVLYVAMTRAEKRLYLVVNENLDKRRICYQNWLWEF